MTMLFRSSEKVKMEGEKGRIEGNKTTVIFCQKKNRRLISSVSTLKTNSQYTDAI